MDEEEEQQRACGKIRGGWRRAALQSWSPVFAPVDSMKLQQIFTCDNIVIENKDCNGKQIQHSERYYCLLPQVPSCEQTADPSTAEDCHCYLQIQLCEK